MAFQHPDLFSSVGVFGSGVLSGDEENVNAWIAAMSPEQQPRVLIDYGDRDIHMAVNAKRTAEILDEWGIPYTLNAGQGDHSYVYWCSNLEMYLRWYAEDW
jgi:S-formylglutathione hydrolase FrmB